MKKITENCKEFKDLKSALLANLSARGLAGIQYADKVDEYMSLWLDLQHLRADIKEHGVSMENAKGEIKENRSVSLKCQVSKQMSVLWKDLGFKNLMESATPEDNDEL